ncbi:cingulin-like [Bolinopsis microptera]|uniref:cingulin-like n=1 Tax=Bolinopsis microptera TaxID=2820187 RepID=UPI00307A6E71
MAISSLCESEGSEAAILIVLATIFVAGLVAVVFFMSPNSDTTLKGGAGPREIVAKSDPKVMESLKEHTKNQKQLAGNIDDVTIKLVELASEIQDIKSENKSYKEELKSTQNKLTGSLEKTITLERDVRDLKSELDKQTRYNAGFEELEKTLKKQIRDLEVKHETSQDIIKTQEFTASSTSDQIAELQSQLELTIEDRNTTREELESVMLQVEKLTTELESTVEKLETTQDLLEQAQSDTEAWTVRVQILSLELGEANSGITDLQEELVTKSRDVDVIRECLVDLRAQTEEDGELDFASHFKDMIDVSTVKSENGRLLETNRDLAEEFEKLKEDCDVYEERVQEVDDELEQLKNEKEEEIAKRVEYATKYDTLSTYFKEKEDGLHCRLSELQVKCKQLEEESSEANILFYKEELSRLKKSHAEVERNLTLQIQTNERKAKDAFTQLRSKDTKLKESQELVRKLKKSNGSTTVIPEEGPVPGPPFIDFPPHLRKSGPPDSPSESSLTSAGGP